ncbi:hypothetical protein BGZ60DRAFT_438223 [Tricladium varicosporioides]|nr:hypothetical protein BGZ60DRAFT_438223 [Hymenoscyphus varicosporioides]
MSASIATTLVRPKHTLFRALVIFQTLILPVAAKNYFLQPWAAGPNKDYSQNDNYNIGVRILLAWSASITNATMSLSQDNFPGDGAGGPSVTLETGISGTTWAWTVTYAGLDPNYHNVYYFSLDGNSFDGFTSHYFYIGKAETKTSVSSRPSATVSPPQSLSSQTFTSSTVQASTPTSTTTLPPTTTVTREATSKDSVQTGTVVGIAVGVVAGALSLIGALWWAWKYKKRQDTAAASSVQAMVPNDCGQQREPLATKPQEADGNQIQEISGFDEQRFFEVDNTEVRTRS